MNKNQYPSIPQNTCQIYPFWTLMVVFLSDLWGYHLFLENSSETVKNCLKELIHGATSWTVTNVDRMWRKFKPMKLSQLSYIFLKSTIKILISVEIFKSQQERHHWGGFVHRSNIYDLPRNSSWVVHHSL